MEDQPLNGLAMPVIIFDFGKGMPLVWIAQLLGLGIDPAGSYRTGGNYRA